MQQSQWASAPSRCFPGADSLKNAHVVERFLRSLTPIGTRQLSVFSNA